MFSRCIPLFRKKNSKNEEFSDPCRPNLQNMPIVVMEEVLKNLDYDSIFRLRKVCRDLQLTIDRIQPKLHVRSLSFQLPLTKESLKSYTRDMSKGNRRCAMYFHKPRTGCRLEWKSDGTTRFSEITMEQADALLRKNKIILDELIINLLFTTEFEGGHIKKKEEDLKKFYETMKSLLKKRDQLRETKEIYLKVHNLSEAAEILKCINPKPLKSISIQYRKWHFYEPIEMDFSELEELEQWKNADVLKIRGNHILSCIETFASFKSVSIWADVIKMEKLNEVKEFFIRSPKLKTFIIESHGLGGMKDKLLPYFSQFGSYNERIEIFGGTERRIWTWLKDVPESTEKLRIILNIGLENHLIFTKV